MRKFPGALEDQNYANHFDYTPFEVRLLPFARFSMVFEVMEFYCTVLNQHFLERFNGFMYMGIKKFTIVPIPFGGYNDSCPFCSRIMEEYDIAGILKILKQVFFTRNWFQHTV